MDYNDVIISLGGVDRITAPAALTLTDAELAAHIANNVIGIKHSVVDVKAQVSVYQAQIEAYKAQVKEITVSELQAQLADIAVKLQALQGSK
jgi:2C-methyl-D-erythritol 2,4-cyclodiphosphate synthase